MSSSLSNSAAIDLYYWPTPNGHKVTMLLEELELAYNLVLVNIGRGDQFDEDFLTISPNNRIPALVDHQPNDGAGSISIFESGAILNYLGQKYDQFLGRSLREKATVSEWLFWQMGGLGPMAGQVHHFRQYAPEHVGYGVVRYTNEVNRLYGVMNRRLERCEFLAGSSYSIADMAAYPWIKPYKLQGQDLTEFPNLNRWFGLVHDRPATIRAYQKSKTIIGGSTPMDDEAKKILLNQTSKK